MSAIKLALVPLVRVGRGGDSTCTSGISSNRKPSSSCAENENETSGSGSRCSGRRNKRPRKHRPYISLRNGPIGDCQPSGSTGSCAVEFGRTEILTSTYAACGCLNEVASTSSSGDASKKSGPGESHKKKQRNEKEETEKPINGTNLPLCHHCREAESWCLRFLSRKIMRLILVQENPSSSDGPSSSADATGSDNYTYRVQIRGENAPHCVSIDGIKCAVVQGNDNDPMTQQQQHEKDDEGWTTLPQVVTMGSVISFHHPGENNDTSNQHERSGKSLHFQLCLIRDTAETGSPSNGCVEVVQVPRGSCSKKDTTCTTGSTCCSPVAAGSSRSLASSCDCASNSKPLTQRSNMSESKIGQNGSCSESQHYHVPPVMATATVTTNNGANSSSQAQTVPGNVAFRITAVVGGDDRNRKESQISALDDPPSAPIGERNGVEAGKSGVAVATSSVASEEGGSTAHPSQSTVEVPSSIPQDPGSTSPALLPPRRSPDSVSSEPASQRSQALHDDTNTPRPATQRSIIDLMTPESSSAATGLNNISRATLEGRGAQEKSEEPTGHSVCSRNHKMHPSPIDLTTSPALKSPTSHSQPRQCIIFFLQLGRGMSRARIELLTKTFLAKKPDTCIVNSFDSSPPPSHVVIDPQIDATNVSSALDFDSPEKMASHFAASKIHAVTPHWVLTCDNLHAEPPIDYLWGGYRRYQSAQAAKPKVRDDEAACGNKCHVCNRSRFTCLTHWAFSISTNVLPLCSRQTKVRSGSSRRKIDG